MLDFPVEGGVTEVVDALDLLYTRYKALGINRYSSITTLIPEKHLCQYFKELILSIHGFLFQDILSNAGAFRNKNESNQGYVYFGPNKRFSGSLPVKLDDEVSKACQHLIKSPRDPRENALLFYQHFVCIHPFHDTNGRIGRFIVDVYLNIHGYRMSWKKLSKNDQWLRKLNECHKRLELHNFNTYFQYLFNYFEPFITQKTED